MCGEKERRRRLATREQPVSRWDALGEDTTDRILHAYRRFPALQVDTTGLTPEQAVGSILALTSQGAC
jgi:hypothetical protein